MKKVLVGGLMAVFVIGMSSCGGDHICDAFHQSDYTKYKTEKTQKVVEVEKTEAAEKK